LVPVSVGIIASLSRKALTTLLTVSSSKYGRNKLTLLSSASEDILLANSGKDYENLADEIQALSDRKKAILTEEAESQGEQDRITEMMEFIENHADQSLDYDEELVRLLVEKATIFENNVVVRFKSGIEAEV
jgi:hypothetical protein